MFKRRKVSLLALVLFLVIPVSLVAAESDESAPPVNPKLLQGLEYRSLEFSRGGRSTAVAGVIGDPLTYYFGSTGGGVWKTTDAGISWKNISDKSFGAGSIGAVAVAPSDPNVIYVGTGSACPRGNVSAGIGLYRSTDAGENWEHIGLPEAGQIGRIQVHPQNPDLVYAAVLGHIFGSNPDRGVYRSRDGGKNWEKVLFVSDKTGAVDLAMNMKNPRVLYASLWTVERKPWTLISGSEEGGIYKSTDGGDTWKRLEGGLPKGLLGRIGVSVSGADPDRVWALVEAEKEGGIYRSDNGGKQWQKVNDEARLRQRPWYYNHIYADPADENTVYVLNTGMYKSTDGGKSYQRIRTPHGDNHDLWISSANNQHMIEGNDGGANVSLNGGASWSTQRNQPTAEIYRLTVDNQYPYRVYGAQQDNSTISVPSQSQGGVVEDWYSVGGCESGHIAVDPRNPAIVYAGCYGGDISRINLETREYRPILIYPQLQLGQAPRELKYRFQWNAPIRISSHDPTHLYHTSQMVHLSRDEGQSWETISPDLTRNDKSKQDYAGQPITHDSTGVEVYGVIFAFEESPHEPGVLWAGSDDGLVHISRNGGKDWQNITPNQMPEWGTVNSIELSAHAPGRAFLAVQRYRMDDFKPYIFRTDDYGKSWRLLTDGDNGIPANHFVRVVREDPDRRGLLYAGTEFGVYASFDEGARWQSLQLNLPVAPVTDMVVHQQDLVLSTQGRAFWILDDLTPLHQIGADTADEPVHLFEPRAGYRSNVGNARINYYLAKTPESKVELEILDSNGKVLASFEGKSEEEGEGEEEESFFGGGTPKLPVKEGLNRFSWNTRLPSLEIPKGVIIWGTRSGAKVVPGNYQVRLKVGETSQTQALEIKPDPRSTVSVGELQQQFDLAAEIRSDIERLYKALSSIREVRSQVKELAAKLKKAGHSDDALQAMSEQITTKVQQLEEKLTQPKSKSGQDALNFPPMLDNQLIEVYGYVLQPNYGPTAGARERLADLRKELEPLMTQVDTLLAQDLKSFNEAVRGKNVGPVLIAN